MSKINIEGISDFQRRRNYSHILTVVMFRPGSTRFAHRVLQDVHTGFYKMFRPGSTRCAHTLLKTEKKRKKPYSHL